MHPQLPSNTFVSSPLNLITVDIPQLYLQKLTFKHWTCHLEFLLLLCQPRGAMLADPGMHPFL